ncbi:MULTISPECIES: hypothetical protein [Actinosynnema]|uniref:hypothetical protein n=1 Tax=Actinosynnema TaxID=40566 RepID=UPI0020A4C359|nr:hypothetical protein [Actinosynnema pretiosum]
MLAGTATEDELALLHHTRTGFGDELAELCSAADTAQRLLENWVRILDPLAALPGDHALAPTGASSAAPPGHATDHRSAQVACRRCRAPARWRPFGYGTTGEPWERSRPC